MRESVNLLPATAVAKYARWRTMLAWTKFLALSLAISLGLVLWSRGWVRKQTRLVAAVEMSTSEARQLRAEIDRLSQQQRQFTKRQADAIRKRSSHSPLAVLACLSQAKAALDGRLLVELVEFDERLTNSQVADHLERANKVTIRVMTDSTQNSSELIKFLEHSGLFRQVRLIGSLTRQQNQRSDLSFSVECRF